MVVLGLSEMPKAMLSLPIGFGKNESGYLPVVVQGLLPNQNLLVTQNGQWVADYIPLYYRTMPFKLAKNPEGSIILCVDHDSGLVTDAPAGYQFFESEGKLTAETNAVAQQLMQFEGERAKSRELCQLLDKLCVIEPWVLQLQHGDNIQEVEGLYRINEKKLMELSAEHLAEVRNAGGLMLCYAQLFSMQHMQQLGTVAQRQHWAAKVAESAGSKVQALNIVEDNGIISFANL